MDSEEDGGRALGASGPVTEFRRKADAVAVAPMDDSADVYIPNVPKNAATMAMLGNAVRGACRHALVHCHCSQCWTPSN